MKRFKSKYETRELLLPICVIGAAIILMLSSCKKYLDVVPDDIATLDNAFSLRVEAEKYLFTCYSFLPKNGDGWYNAGMFSADEIWYPQNEQTFWHAAFRIAQGQQNVSDPLFNEWEGTRKGGDGNTVNSQLKIWVGIRDCNIFLDNMSDMSKVPDISPSERSRWIGEGQFLKAYYLFYMLRMYGPIPLIEKNIPIDAPVDQSYSKRMPVDSCVNYISNLLDSAVARLPATITDENKELGRATQPIALAVKARLWVMAASPLFNGNPDYASFKDNDGVALFNSSYDANKWVKARDAVKAAIESAEANNFSLYTYTNDVYNLSDETKTQLSIRNAITTRWGQETVWGNSQSYFINENLCIPPLEGTNKDRFTLQGVWAPTMKMAKLFYTKNGVPIDEDKTLDYSHYDQLRTATTEEQYYIEPGYVTARLNFDREPRFYADLAFDGSIWYQKDGGSPTGSDRSQYWVKAKNSDRAGFGDFIRWSETGYFVKKLVSWQTTIGGTGAATFVGYPWPEVRMADLYLLYAETLNEVEPGSAMAITYLDKVRARAGLKGVVESWNTYSNNPSKYASQDGLRSIIHRERAIEMMFEGQRLWDLKRWKEAGDELNKDITGWNITSKTADAYYKERTVFGQSFIAPRDYFWPIGDYDTRRNPNLVENLGW